jgi:polyribonucleotide nucleotidyltransferase
VRAAAFDKMVWALDTFERKEREVRSQKVKEETIAAMEGEFPGCGKDWTP